MDLHSFLERFKSALLHQGLVCACQGAGWEELLKAEISPACRQRLLTQLHENQVIKGPFIQQGLTVCDFQIREGKISWQVQVGLGSPLAPALCMFFHRSSPVSLRSVAQVGTMATHTFSISG